VTDKSQLVCESVLSPPLVLDANGDHIPDILTHSCHEPNATLWISRGFLREFKPLSVPSPVDYHTAHYVDLTDDNLADVVVEGHSSV
jgi:hypothetical protein